MVSMSHMFCNFSDEHTKALRHTTTTHFCGGMRARLRLYFFFRRSLTSQHFPSNVLCSFSNDIAHERHVL